MKTDKHQSLAFKQLQATIAANLKHLLDEDGKQRQVMAAGADLSRTTLYKLERGEQDPQLSTICAIADFAKVNPAFLLLGPEDWRAVIWAVLAAHPDAEQISDSGEARAIGRKLGQAQLPGLGCRVAEALAAEMTHRTPTATSVGTLADWIEAAEGRVVVMTGAGMRTEAGLADFRSPGGYLQDPRHQHLTHVTAVETHAEDFTAFYRARLATEPEPVLTESDRLLAEWQRRGLIRTLMTLNTDGRHQAAKSPQVLELFGNIRATRCHRCGHEAAPEAFLAGEVPRCPRKGCAGMLRPALLLRGEDVWPELRQVWDEAERAIREARLFVVLGSSLKETRAARFPYLARWSGARLAIVDRAKETELDPIAHARLTAGIGETLRDLARMMKA